MDRSWTKVVVFGVDWLGDTVFAIPALRALKKASPELRIDYILPKHLASIALASHCVDEITPFTERPFLLGLPQWISLIWKLRKQKYDGAIFLHRSYTRALAAFFAQIPHRVGYAHKKRDRLMTQIVSPPSINEHRVISYCRVVESLGISVDEYKVKLYLEKLNSSTYQALTRKHHLKKQGYVVIHPGANWDLKRWPADSFKEVIQSLKHDGEEIVFCGTRNDFSLAQDILDRAEIKGVNVCGLTDLESLMFLIANSKALISNDSGPVHLAAAFSVPYIALFGPTSAEATRPMSQGSSILISKLIGCDIPCYFKRCHDRLCLQSIQPAEVVNAYRKLTAQSAHD